MDCAPTYLSMQKLELADYLFFTYSHNSKHSSSSHPSSKALDRRTGLVRSVFKLWLLPKQKQRNKQQQKEKHTKQNNKQATPIVDKQKGKQGIGVEGRALHKALKLK